MAIYIFCKNDIITFLKFSSKKYPKTLLTRPFNKKSKMCFQLCLNYIL